MGAREKAREAVDAAVKRTSESQILVAQSVARTRANIDAINARRSARQVAEDDSSQTEVLSPIEMAALAHTLDTAAQRSSTRVTGRTRTQPGVW